MTNTIVQEDLDRIVEGSNLAWSELENKTVLISGANGFLPAYIVETLLYLNEKKDKKKTKIIGLVRNKKRALTRFAEYQNRDDLELVVQDVCNAVSFGEHIKIDYIIHAASQPSPKYYGNDPIGTLLPNVLGTHNLLTIGRKNNVKCFLFFSSSEVYGQVHPSQIPIKEDTYGFLDSMDVRSCYAESKRMGETMCVSWFHQYSLPTKIVRPFHTYGPGMRLDDGRVYADFVADIVKNRDIVMKSDGRATRSFCYLADAIIAFFTVLLKGEPGQAYNVGSDKYEISILDLATILVSLFPEKKLKVVKQECLRNDGYLPSKVSRSRPDISKLRALGWEPETSIEVGFTRTVRSFL